MSFQLINILENSPTQTFQTELDLGDTLALRYILFSFDLILLSTLNHAKLPNITLFSFTLDKFFSEVSLKVQNDFDIFRMKYDTAINLNYPGAYVNSTEVFVDKYNYEEERAQSVVVRYRLQGNEHILTSKRAKFSMRFGSSTVDKNYHFGRFTIADFHYQLTDQNGKVISSSQPKTQLRSNALSQLPVPSRPSPPAPTLQNYHLQHDSFPVVYLTQLNNLLYDGSEQYFIQLISALQPYTATNTSSKPYHLFICHDMKSGYAQDTKFVNNLMLSRTNSYRINYLWHTGVFNYFSHKTISIPPRHWRQVCKRYQVKCLGTFIVQAQKVSQSYYISNEFALKLVYLAKRHKFDGYLLNIQDAVKDVQKLKEWLKFLRQKLHQQIPGSLLTWYDSITVKGNVEYQNEVNDNNKVFYQLTDTFFTNYWWSDQKLKDDIKQAQPNKTIYVGNDIWGRGTFGGGEYFTFKGVNEIQKFNKPNQPNLVPALFAPAYTYETGGQNNNAYFKANQDRLYRGVIFDKSDIKQWQDLDQTYLRDMELDEQKEWESKFYTQNLWAYKNKKKLKINFLFKIKENITANLGIKTLDYKIILRVRQTVQQTILQTVTQERLNVPLTSTNMVRHVELFINTDKITSRSNLEILVATTVAKSFDNEERIVAFYEEELDWVQNIPITNINFNKPYNTFFNLGHGQTFFIKGQPTKNTYDYLADYDLPQTLAINHPFATSLQHNDAYIGGSSLIVNQQTVVLLSIDQPTSQYNYPVSYEIKIASKGGPIETVYLSQTNGFSIFLDKTSQNRLKSGWVEETFELSKESMKKMKKKFFKQLQTFLSLSVKSKCLIGQVLLRPKMLDEKQKPQSKIELIISQSFKTPYNNQIFISLKLNQIITSDQDQPSQTRRYLLKVGQQYAGFVYFQRDGDKFRGKMDQVPISLEEEKLKIEVVDVDSQLRENLLLSEEGIDFNELKQQPLSHKIHLSNY